MTMILLIVFIQESPLIADGNILLTEDRLGLFDKFVGKVI
jgi:hypothetical protein